MNIITNAQRVTDWVLSKNEQESSFCLSTAIGLESDGKLIAGTIYESYNGRCVSMHTAIERMNRDFLWYCFYYPFCELNVKKVLGVVDSFNTRAIKLDQHLGFTLETTIKDAGKKGDLLIFSMTRDQCRWLNVARHLGVADGRNHWRQRRQQTA